MLPRSVSTSFGDLLRRHRLATGLTQEQLAERAGLSWRGISDLERGVRRAPHRQTVLLLAEALGLSPTARAAFESAARQAVRLGSPPGSRPGQLPAALTSFIGRERELSVLRRRLRDEHVRLLSLTGPPGIGKTRLAIAIAAELGAEFAGGVSFVALAPLRDGSLVAATIARSVGLRDNGPAPVAESLKAFLRERECLLVLDNFEHLVDAASVIADLLAACARLKILVTSRVVLHLSGEHVMAVPPLTLPRLDSAPDSDELLRSEAVQLFVARAQMAGGGIGLEAGAPIVAAICRRLEGLPLAIELAAARSRLLTLPELLAHLDKPLEVLTGGARDLPGRLQSLRGAIAWSYDLLDDAEQRLLRRLSIVAGGATLEMIEAVCNADRDLGPHVLDGVQSLVDKSLLVRREGAGAARFGMLEAVREFAAERLAAAGERAAVQERHLDYLCALAGRYEVGYESPDQGLWLERLADELPNVRIALAAAQEHQAIELGLGLYGSLGLFWRVHGHHREGESWGNALLHAPGAQTAPVSVRAKAWFTAAGIAFHLRDPARRSLLAESAELFRAAGSESYQGWALTWLALTEHEAGDAVAARRHVDEGVALCRRAGRPWHLAWAVYFRGVVSNALGDPVLARADFEESVTLSRRIGDTHVLGWALFQLARLEMSVAGFAAAAARFAEAGSLFRLKGDRQQESRCLLAAAEAATYLSAYDEATAALEAARGLLEDGLDHLWPAFGLALSAALLARGRARPAARVLGALEAAHALKAGAQQGDERWDVIGQTAVAADDLQLRPQQRYIEPVRAALNQDAFAAAWDVGRATPLVRAIAGAYTDLPAGLEPATPLARGETSSLSEPA